MEKNKKITETNWGLIEEIAQKLYPDEFDLASRSDLDFIEQQVADGKVLSLENDGGDMHSYELYIMTLQLAISTLHLLFDYFFSNPYRLSKKKKDLKDFVGKVLGDDELSKELRAEMKEMLISRRDDINQLLSLIEINDNQDSPK